jgi:hypothetical protein
MARKFGLLERQIAANNYECPPNSAAFGAHVLAQRDFARVEEMMTAQIGSQAARDTAEPQNPSAREPKVDLGRRYGAIGISAVAAAVRYAGDRKNQAYAPVVHRVEKRFTEVAAA